jgi:3-oxoacyl-[acyl-carrier-protein] synthase-1
MSASLAVIKAGLVTSVGFSAAATCAAIRAAATNPSETRFRGNDGNWIMGHGVPFVQSWRGRTKHIKMAALAIADCLNGVSPDRWSEIPLLLCLAERERPGRIEGMDAYLIRELERELHVRFATNGALFPHGRVSACLALAHARTLIADGAASSVLIVGVDSLLTWPTLSGYQRDDRLLTERNSNGFMPGEAAGAILVGSPARPDDLLCAGIGLATERAHILSDEPLRGDGLTDAIKRALADAGCELHDLDYRISALSGEQYYFKEAALALNRILRRRKEEFELWHPADGIGDTGAAAGLMCLAVARAAATLGYAPGRGVLLHLSADDGTRGAVVASSGPH